MTADEMLAEMMAHLRAVHADADVRAEVRLASAILRLAFAAEAGGIKASRALVVMACADAVKRAAKKKELMDVAVEHVDSLLAVVATDHR